MKPLTYSTNMTITKLSKLIKERKFGWVNSTITDSLFKTPKEISTDFKLFNFDRYISSEDVIKEMEKEGYKPANAWELLSWKDWNEKDWVVALGSVGEVRGLRHVVYLYRYDAKRYLDLSYWVGDWYAGSRFLAVRNSRLSTSEPETTLENSDPLALGAPCPHCGELVRVNFSK